MNRSLTALRYRPRLLLGLGMARRFPLWACAILFLIATLDSSLAVPKRVLLLHSFGRDFSPWAEFAAGFRAEVNRKSPDPIELFDVALMTERFGLGQHEGPLVDYLQALFAERPVDLIVAFGGPAANFIQKHRPRLFVTTPLLFTGVDRRRISPAALTANDTAIATSINFESVVENILRVLPETRNIAVVVGNAPSGQYWREQMRDAVQLYADRVTFTWLNDLSVDDTLKRAATLPPRSAIFFFSLQVDAAGVTQDEGKAFGSLRAVANAPIFGFIDTKFGEGIVGGPLIAVSDVSQQAAAVAVRILSGEAVGGIKTTPIGPGTPKFDWRELQRWNISQARLPPGSEVHFRELTLWEQYRWHLSAAFAIVLFQAGMIAWLLFERRRRSSAEMEARDRRGEAIHLNRVTTATVLSSSIAHELSQPLGAVLLNTQTVQHMLRDVPPDLSQIHDILSDVVRDNQRASEIVHHQRNFLKKERGVGLQVFDLNESVREVVGIAASEATKRGVALRAGRASEALPVRANRVQIQQVLLNLVMNGMDALESRDPSAREVIIQASRSAESKAIEVTVSDSGEGIPEDRLRSVFDPFFTTKPLGTGLGLPIARTLIETHGGTIWAENRVGGGAVFRFTIPLA